MKTKYLLTLVPLILSGVDVFGHEQSVHQIITFNAAQSAYDSSPAYRNLLNAISSDMIMDTATNWIVAGSYNEDYGVDQDLVGGYRSMNHFYDPLTGDGLTDFPPDTRVSPTGQDSFTWASTLDCPGIDFRVAGFPINVNTLNKWSWKNARAYEWDALTAASQSARQNSLRNMFRAVGQVIHLLEDTSQPQHVRNEQHLIFGILTMWRSPIEKYGDDNVRILSYQHGLLDWQAAGFTRLEDFWNRHLYNGNASGLNADGGTSTLGLAEFANGNFLGARHLFPEYFTQGHIEYYPYPSRNHSTDYTDVKAHPGSHVDNLRGKVTGKGIYLAKTGDGTTYNHIARVNYLGAKVPGLKGVPYCTIKDDNVLNDYHNKLIPKAVAYSAGILDYFSRGKLETAFKGMSGTDVQFKITNKSGQGQDLKGGTFRLFFDDTSSSHIRSELTGTSFVPPWSDSSTLSDGSSITATFTPPVADVQEYMLVYQGTIGTTAGGAALDPVDSTIAVATAAVPPPPVWWKMEEGSGDRIDAVQSVALVPSANVVTGPGIIANGVVLAAANSWDRLATAPTTKLGYNGSTSISIVGWFRVRSPTGSIALEHASFSLEFWYDAAQTQQAGHLACAFTGQGFDVGAASASGAGGSVSAPSFAPGQDWHFCYAFYDVESKTVGIQLDGGPLYESPATAPIPAAPFGTFAIDFSDSPIYPGAVDFDEAGIFFQKLTPEQAAYIYSGGAGQTWPIQLP